ncbi:MAG: hypothetical protein E7352_05860 [Clostridiales bacterium]|nr:hypothetical protein [Clostridiales bacterium]
MKKFSAFLLCVGFAFALTACGKDHGNSSESGGTKTSFYTVTSGYDYGFHIQDKPYMLYNDSRLFFELPEDHGEVVAGDTFTIEYTGELRINETYPSETYVLNGEIVSVTAQKAETVPLWCQVSENGAIEFYLRISECIIGEKVNVQTRPEYYLTNEKGEIGYEELTTAADGMVFYGTYSVTNGYDETDGYRLSGLYSWNVRGE